MEERESENMKILTIFSVFKEQRLRLYESIAKDIENFENWAIPAERLLAYYITLRNLKKFGENLKAKVQREISRINEGGFSLQ